MSEKNPTHYIDNEEFQAELVVYTKLYDEAIAAGKPAPQLSNSIGAKILLMVDRISYRHNYAKYPHLDLMRGHAIENSIRTLMRGNYDPVKFNNPYGYFTRIINWAFWEIIKKEKMAFHTKVAIVQNSEALNMESSRQAQDSDCDFTNQYAEFLRGFYDIELEEKPKKEKKTRARRTNPNVIDMTKLADADKEILPDIQDD